MGFEVTTRNVFGPKARHATSNPDVAPIVVSARGGGRLRWKPTIAVCLCPKLQCLSRSLTLSGDASRSCSLGLLDDPWVGALCLLFSFVCVCPQLTEEEKAKIAEEVAKKAERANSKGGGLNPLAVLVLLLAISVGKPEGVFGLV